MSTTPASKMIGPARPAPHRAVLSAGISSLRMLTGGGKASSVHILSTVENGDESVVTFAPGRAGSEMENDWEAFLTGHGYEAMYCSPRIVAGIASGLSQTAYIIEDREQGRLVGLLPIVFMRSALFGRFLVSVPYVNWAGVIADRPESVRRLVGRATTLADELRAKFLELRSINPFDDPGLVPGATSKVQMRLALSDQPDVNWKGLKSEVRTQVRKAIKGGLELEWGGEALLDDFYTVFAHNMRDLGTPVFPSQLFRQLLRGATGAAELGIVRKDGKAIAGCLAMHGLGLTEVPSAAVLRSHRKTAANSLMYWCAIERAIERGQTIFDFGRSTPDSSTFTFKRKWGAEPVPVTWQYHLREGDAQAMRPDNGKFDLAIALWKWLPLTVSRVLGPMIIRGIP